MVNYVGCARSNYFAVKNLEAFEKWMDVVPGAMLHAAENDVGDALCCIVFEEGLPSDRFDDEAEDYVEIDWVGGLQEHLVDGETVVFMEVGHEKMRYLSGNAWAIHSDGRELNLNLVDMYEMCRKEFGERPSVAEY